MVHEKEDNVNWKILDTGFSRAEENMSIDTDLLKNLDPRGEPILHLYEWEGDSATYGHFINPANFLNLEEAQNHNLTLAKRPTGGGIVFHICDFAFSILVPSGCSSFSINTMDNYAYVNNLVIRAIKKNQGEGCYPQLLPLEPQPLDEQSRHFCMAKPTRYDVMLEGKKIGGAAQRRTKKGFLHQGTISLAMLSEDYLRSVLLPGSQVLLAMKNNSYSLLGKNWTEKDLSDARKEMKQTLIEIIRS